MTVICVRANCKSPRRGGRGELNNSASSSLLWIRNTDIVNTFQMQIYFHQIIYLFQCWLHCHLHNILLSYPPLDNSDNDGWWWWYYILSNCIYYSHLLSSCILHISTIIVKQIADCRAAVHTFGVKTVSRGRRENICTTDLIWCLSFCSSIPSNFVIT